MNKRIWFASVVVVSIALGACVTGCGDKPAPGNAVVANTEVSVKKEAKEKDAPRAEPKKTPKDSTEVKESKTKIDPKEVVVRQDPKKVEPKPVEPKPKDSTMPAGEVVFPKDAGGTWLEKNLVPGIPLITSSREITKPQERNYPDWLMSPSLIEKGNQPVVPALPVAPGKAMKPMSLPERLPTELAPRTPEVPALEKAYVAPATKTESRDVTRLADLPPQGRYVADRAPLDDPTREFTADAAIAKTLPLREMLAPFVRYIIPDPFEFQGATLKEAPLASDPNKVLGVVPIPKSPIMK